MRLIEKEADIQRTCLEYLDMKGIMYLRLNSGDVYRPGAAGKMYRVKGCPKGTSDVLILHHKLDGEAIFCEFKSVSGNQTVEQQLFEADVRCRGFRYHVIRSLDELMEVLK